MLGLGLGSNTSQNVSTEYVTLTATTEAVTDVTDTGATFNGSYRGGNNVTSCGFDISFNSDMSNSIVLSVPGTPSDFSLEFPVLIEGFTYYYRAFASDATSGKVTGSILNFTATGTAPTLPNLPEPELVYTPNWNKGTAIDTNLDYWAPFFSFTLEDLQVLSFVTDENNVTKYNVVKVQNKVQDSGTESSTIGLALFQSAFEGDVTNTFNIEAGATYRFIFDIYIPSANNVTQTGRVISIGDSSPFQEFTLWSANYTSSDQGRWKTITKDLTVADPLEDNNHNIVITAENDTSTQQEDKFYIANLAVYKV